MFLFGIIFIVFGAAFLLVSMGIISANVFNIIIALVAIFIGLKCLLKKKGGHHGGHHGCCGKEHKHGGE